MIKIIVKTNIIFKDFTKLFRVLLISIGKSKLQIFTYSKSKIFNGICTTYIIHNEELILIVIKTCTTKISLLVTIIRKMRLNIKRYSAIIFYHLKVNHH